MDTTQNQSTGHSSAHGHGHDTHGRATRRQAGWQHDVDHKAGGHGHGHDSHGHGEHHGPSLEDLLKDPIALARSDFDIFGFRRYEEYPLPAHRLPENTNVFKDRLATIKLKMDEKKKLAEMAVNAAQEKETAIEEHNKKGFLKKLLAGSPRPINPNEPTLNQLVAARDAIAGEQKELVRGAVADLIFTNNWRPLTAKEAAARDKFLAQERSNTGAVESNITTFLDNKIARNSTELEKKIAKAAIDLKVAMEKFANDFSVPNIIEKLRAAGVTDDKIVHKVLARAKLYEKEVRSLAAKKSMGSGSEITAKIYGLKPETAAAFDNITHKFLSIGIAREKPTPIGSPERNKPQGPSVEEARDQYDQDMADFKAFILRNSADPDSPFNANLDLLWSVLKEPNKKTGLTPAQVEERNKVLSYLKAHGLTDSEDLAAALPTAEERDLYNGLPAVQDAAHHTTSPAVEGIKDTLSPIADTRYYDHAAGLLLRHHQAIELAKDTHLAPAEHAAAVENVKRHLRELDTFAQDNNLQFKLNEQLISLKKKQEELLTSEKKPEESTHTILDAERVVEEKAAIAEILSGEDLRSLETIIGHVKQNRVSEIFISAVKLNPKVLYFLTKDYLAKTAELAKKPAVSRRELGTPGSQPTYSMSTSELHDIRASKALLQFLQKNKVSPEELAAKLPSAADLAIAGRIKAVGATLPDDHLEYILSCFANLRFIKGPSALIEKNLERTLAEAETLNPNNKSAVSAIRELVKNAKEYDKKPAAPAGQEQALGAMEARGNWYIEGDKVPAFFTDMSFVSAEQYAKTGFRIQEVSNGKISRLTEQPLFENSTQKIKRIYVKTPDGTEIPYVDFRFESERAPERQALYLADILTEPNRSQTYNQYVTKESLARLHELGNASEERVKEMAKKLGAEARSFSPLAEERLLGLLPPEQRRLLTKIMLGSLSQRLFNDSVSLNLENTRRLAADADGVLHGALEIAGITYPVINNRIIREFNDKKVLGFACDDFNAVKGKLTLEEDGKPRTHRFENGVLYRMPSQNIKIAGDFSEVAAEPDEAAKDWQKVLAPVERDDESPDHGARSLATDKTLNEDVLKNLDDDTGLWLGSDGKLEGRFNYNGKWFVVTKNLAEQTPDQEVSAKTEFLKLYNQALESILGGSNTSYLPNGVITLETIAAAVPGAPGKEKLSTWQKIAGADQSASWAELFLARMLADGLVKELKQAGFFKKGPRTFVISAEGQAWKEKIEEAEKTNNVRETEQYEQLTAQEEDGLVKAYLFPTGANSRLAEPKDAADDTTYTHYRKFLATGLRHNIETPAAMLDRLSDISNLFGIDDLQPAKLPNISDNTRFRIWQKIIAGAKKEFQSPAKAAPDARPAEARLTLAQETDIINEYATNDPNSAFGRQMADYKSKGLEALYLPSNLGAYLETLSGVHSVGALHPNRLRAISDVGRFRIWLQIWEKLNQEAAPTPEQQAKIISDYVSPSLTGEDVLKMEVFQRSIFSGDIDAICSKESMETHLDNFKSLFGIDSLKTAALPELVRLRIWTQIVEALEKKLNEHPASPEVNAYAGTQRAMPAVDQNGQPINNDEISFSDVFPISIEEQAAQAITPVSATSETVSGMPAVTAPDKKPLERLTDTPGFEIPEPAKPTTATKPAFERLDEPLEALAAATAPAKAESRTKKSDRLATGRAESKLNELLGAVQDLSGADEDDTETAGQAAETVGLPSARATLRLDQIMRDREILGQAEAGEPAMLESAAATSRLTEIITHSAAEAMAKGDLLSAQAATKKLEDLLAAQKELEKLAADKKSAGRPTHRANQKLTELLSHREEVLSDLGDIENWVEKIEQSHPEMEAQKRHLNVFITEIKGTVWGGAFLEANEILVDILHETAKKFAAGKYTIGTPYAIGTLKFGLEQLQENWQAFEKTNTARGWRGIKTGKAATADGITPPYLVEVYTKPNAEGQRLIKPNEQSVGQFGIFDRTTNKLVDTARDQEPIELKIPGLPAPRLGQVEADRYEVYYNPNYSLNILTGENKFPITVEANYDGIRQWRRAENFEELWYTINAFNEVAAKEGEELGDQTDAQELDTLAGRSAAPIDFKAFGDKKEKREAKYRRAAEYNERTGILKIFSPKEGAQPWEIDLYIPKLGFPVLESQKINSYSFRYPNTPAYYSLNIGFGQKQGLHEIYVNTKIDAYQTRSFSQTSLAGGPYDLSQQVAEFAGRVAHEEYIRRNGSKDTEDFNEANQKVTAAQRETVAKIVGEFNKSLAGRTGNAKLDKRLQADFKQYFYQKPGLRFAKLDNRFVILNAALDPMYNRTRIFTNYLRESLGSGMFNALVKRLPTPREYQEALVKNTNRREPEIEKLVAKDAEETIQNAVSTFNTVSQALPTEAAFTVFRNYLLGKDISFYFNVPEPALRLTKELVKAHPEYLAAVTAALPTEAAAAQFLAALPTEDLYNEVARQNEALPAATAGDTSAEEAQAEEEPITPPAEVKAAPPVSEKPEADKLKEARATLGTALAGFVESFTPGTRLDRYTDLLASQDIKLTAESFDSSELLKPLEVILTSRGLKLDDFKKVLPTNKKYEQRLPLAKERATAARAAEEEYNKIRSEIISNTERGSAFLKEKGKLFQNVISALTELSPAVLSEKARPKSFKEAQETALKAIVKLTDEWNKYLTSEPKPKKPKKKTT